MCCDLHTPNHLRFLPHGRGDSTVGKIISYLDSGAKNEGFAFVMVTRPEIYLSTSEINEILIW